MTDTNHVTSFTVLGPIEFEVTDLLSIKECASTTKTEPAVGQTTCQSLFFVNNRSNTCNGVEVVNRNQKNINDEEASTTDL
jgi:hypothetical protein